jgi:hypothetical protein
MVDEGEQTLEAALGETQIGRYLLRGKKSARDFDRVTHVIPILNSSLYCGA